MSLLYWVAGIIALALMVFLVFALLQPERFE
ncbi:MAG: K(+)-transporting ATPase subunit F [bacterium]|jgi:K+-transporting ATPase KdpF subunit